MKKIYNTIIIGAGLAGLNAARFLSEDTLILDRKKEIGLPIRCAEGISLYALQRENIEVQNNWISTETRQVKRIMPNGTVLGEKQEIPYAFVIKKDKFEKHLASLVNSEIIFEEKAIDFKQKNNIWEVKTAQGNSYFCKYIVGADGPSSVVARKIFNIVPEVIGGICYEVTLQNNIPTDELQMHIGSNIIPQGYAWVFPLSPHSANIGILTKEKSLQSKLAKYFDQFLKNSIQTNYGEFILKQNKSGAIPSGSFFDVITINNAFLAGDAGGFTDPIFEGGMNMALLTGRLAAESINKDNPALYSSAINSFPFTAKELLEAQQIFYNFDEKTLNELGNLLDNKSTSFLKTKEGMQEFSTKKVLIENKDKLFRFFEIWEKAKKFLW
jgi:digeranylgeranylglycerophospholipid reductase